MLTGCFESTGLIEMRQQRPPTQVCIIGSWVICISTLNGFLFVSGKMQIECVSNLLRYRFLQRKHILEFRIEVVSPDFDTGHIVIQLDCDSGSILLLPNASSKQVPDSQLSPDFLRVFLYPFKLDRNTVRDHS